MKETKERKNKKKINKINKKRKNKRGLKQNFAYIYEQFKSKPQMPRCSYKCQ